jgi:hypothetical protein
VNTTSWHDTRELLEVSLPAIAMLNLGTSLALAGLAATLVTVDDTAVERADYWARRAGIDITTAEKTTS